MNRKTCWYALYRGDEFVDVGTLRELAVRHHTSIKTLRFKATPTYAARTNYADTVRVYKLGKFLGGEEND